MHFNFELNAAAAQDSSDNVVLAAERCQQDWLGRSLGGYNGARLLRRIPDKDCRRNISILMRFT